jgi:nitroreductase
MSPDLGFIFKRRSVRKYVQRSIPAETMQALLEAAMAAPSACCKDPWDFIVVSEPGTQAAIAAALPNGGMLAQAPACIVVCGDLQRAHAGELSYLLQDCAAAIENLLLAAQACGLGACWLGVHPRPERIAHLRTLFKLPEHIVPVSVIAIGWPAETPAPRTRYAAARVHRECW